MNELYKIEDLHKSTDEVTCLAYRIEERVSYCDVVSYKLEHLDSFAVLLELVEDDSDMVNVMLSNISRTTPANPKHVEAIEEKRAEMALKMAKSYFEELAQSGKGGKPD